MSAQRHARGAARRICGFAGSSETRFFLSVQSSDDQSASPPIPPVAPCRRSLPAPAGGDDARAHVDRALAHVQRDEHAAPVSRHRRDALHTRVRHAGSRPRRGRAQHRGHRRGPSHGQAQREIDRARHRRVAASPGTPEIERSGDAHLRSAQVGVVRSGYGPVRVREQTRLPDRASRLRHPHDHPREEDHTQSLDAGARRAIRRATRFRPPSIRRIQPW